MHSLFLDQLLVKAEEILCNEERHSTGTSQKKPSPLQKQFRQRQATEQRKVMARPQQATEHEMSWQGLNLPGETG